VTHWAGFCGYIFTQSADGKRFTFLSLQSPPAPNIAEVLSNGGLGPSRPLVDNSWDKFVTGWTSDSQSVLFESNPQGRWGIFRQNVRTQETQTVLSGPDRYENALVSPDGRWLLFTQYSSSDDKSGRLMRMSINGGSSTAILEGNFSYDCASQANVCVLSELTATQRVFSILDPLKGRGAELARVELVLGNHSWSLSPDGQKIAFAALYDGHNGNQIQVFNLESGSKTRPVSLEVSHPENWRVQSVAWAPDNQHLYVSAWTGSSFEISLVTLDGQVTKLVEKFVGQEYLYAPKPSPDGRYLAYLQRSLQTNVTMLENY
jgi:Tol biopolymer transport system component